MIADETISVPDSYRVLTGHAITDSADRCLSPDWPGSIY